MDIYRKLCDIDIDDCDVNKTADEISLIMNGNFNQVIREYGDIVTLFDILYLQNPDSENYDDLFFELVRRGARPSHECREQIHDFVCDDRTNIIRVLLNHGLDPDTHVFNIHILYFAESYEMALLFLFHGSNPTRTDPDSFFVPIGPNPIIEKSIIIKPIINTIKSFILATCVDDIHFKETMMYSLWPHLRDNLFL